MEPRPSQSSEAPRPSIAEIVRGLAWVSVVVGRLGVQAVREELSEVAWRLRRKRRA